jgi:hypothetical protein
LLKRKLYKNNSIFQNPELIRMFLKHGSDQPLPLLTTGLCREQYFQLQAQTLRAKEHGAYNLNIITNIYNASVLGKMPFAVEHRSFNYSDWYPAGAWQPDAELLEAEQEASQYLVAGTAPSIDEVYPTTLDL